ncbi:MFS transporter, DHA1 family, tetracycline resistance protein [Hydrocarboniphaga daqingensis]|uniref:MFS transporter, DHA1 family, tetracycline resistance protein n=1 Tax=Hydrocarboniphaga daqingensis TaxID=490188 RepID=A0A1M5K0V1_9GAMM|nr:TCR/Tet family MFS transporter [Hydrocarboniphaga daqingensis]SHG46434.1 MFS transporter, DHA1 family, tetracycline resistance protein [Hydrocarboniphaga daqingensis]
MSEAPSVSGGPRRGALLFIFFTVLLDVLGLGLVIPVLPKLIESFSGGDTAHAASVMALFGTAWALMQFVFSPLLGMLSDRYGRRPVILLSCLGLGLDYALMALAPDLTWLFIGRLISGITAANFATAGAYIADVTPPARRAAGYGVIGAGFGLGFVVGPAVGGMLGSLDPRLPFWIASALALANFGYGLLVLPESLPPERRTPRLVWRRANPVGALQLLRSHPELLGLASVYGLFHLAHQVFSNTFVLYTGYRYGWDTHHIGWALTAVGVCGIVVQGGLVRRCVARFGERPTLFAGLVCGVVGLTLWATAATPTLFWAGLPLISLMGLFGPAAQGLMTRHVDASEQGRLQGANASLMGMAGIVGPSLFNLSFAHFIAPSPFHAPFPGAPFWLAAVLLGAGLLIAVQITRTALRAEQPQAAT